MVMGEGSRGRRRRQGSLELGMRASSRLSVQRTSLSPKARGQAAGRRRGPDPHGVQTTPRCPAVPVQKSTHRIPCALAMHLGTHSHRSDAHICTHKLKLASVPPALPHSASTPASAHTHKDSLTMGSWPPHPPHPSSPSPPPPQHPSTGIHCHTYMLTLQTHSPTNTPHNIHKPRTHTHTHTHTHALLPHITLLSQFSYTIKMYTHIPGMKIGDCSQSCSLLPSVTRHGLSASGHAVPLALCKEPQ
jgi:hypothetical protein